MNERLIQAYHVFNETLNGLLAAANKVQMLGHGLLNVYVRLPNGALASGKYKVSHVSTYHNPITDEDEVVIELKEEHAEPT